MAQNISHSDSISKLHPLNHSSLTCTTTLAVKGHLVNDRQVQVGFALSFAVKLSHDFYCEASNEVIFLNAPAQVGGLRASLRHKVSVRFR